MDVAALAAITEVAEPTLTAVLATALWLRMRQLEIAVRALCARERQRSRRFENTAAHETAGQRRSS